jgi:hypothetical protein
MRAAVSAARRADQVEGRGLAGTVGTDQADDLAGRTFRLTPLTAFDAAETFADRPAISRRMSHFSGSAAGGS